MGKKKKVLEVKERVERIEEEDLKELVDVVNQINSIQFNIGRIETQKHKMLHDLAVGNDHVSRQQDKMMQKYGSYDINLKDGTINWPKEDENEK
mgnify:CR=1 FL=1